MKEIGLVQGMQDQVRTVTERYIAKSHAIIIMVSTPNEPGGLFQKIEREIELGKQGLAPKSMYSDLQLNWEAGLDQPEKGIRGIFTREEIERQKLTPAFEREYNLSYGFGLGNILAEPQIKKSEELGIKLGSVVDNSFEIETLSFNVYSRKIMGVDPGWNDDRGSKFGITVVELLENIEIEKDVHGTVIRVLYSKEHEKIDYQDAMDICWKLVVKFDIERIYVDGSQNNVIRSLKHNFGEEMDYHSDDSDQANWHVYPVSFAKESRILLQKVIKFMNKEKITINPYFNNLLSELRTARHEEYALSKDKKSGATYDEMDSFRLCLKHFSI